MSVRPQSIVPHYFEYGPRPFSGYALPYYDVYFLETMVALRAWQLAVGWPEPFTFYLYTLTKAEGEPQYTFRRGPITNYAYSTAGSDSVLVDELLWDARNLDDLRTAANQAIAIEHAAEVYEPSWNKISFKDWAQDALDGYAKTIIGNYFWDMQYALLFMLYDQKDAFLRYIPEIFGNSTYNDQERTVRYWLEVFKEAPGSLLGGADLNVAPDQYMLNIGFPNANGRVEPGHESYNLTTDHLEALRPWPRSCVLVVDTPGQVGILDAWCQDLQNGIPYSAGHKACRYGLRHRLLDGMALDIGTVKAVVEDKAFAQDGAGFYMLGASMLAVNLNALWTAAPIATVTTAEARDLATRDGERFHILMTGTNPKIVTIDRSGSHFSGEYAANLWVTPGIAVDGALPDYLAFLIWEAGGLDFLTRDAVYWRHPSNDDLQRTIAWGAQQSRCLVVADQSSARLLMIAYHPGYRGEATWPWQDFFRVVGEVPLSWIPSGVCMETEDGTPKGGPPTRWRALVGECGGARIRPVDIRCDYPCEALAATVLDEPEPGGAPRYVAVDELTAPHHVMAQGEYRQVDCAPLPNYRIRFTIPTSLQSYDVGYREICRSGGGLLELHAICGISGHVLYPQSGLVTRGAGDHQSLAHVKWKWPTDAQLTGCLLGITYAIIDDEPTFTVPASDVWCTVTTWDIPITVQIDWGAGPVTLTLGDTADGAATTAAGEAKWLTSSLDWTADGSGEPRFLIAAFYGLGGIAANDWTVLYADSTPVGCKIPHVNVTQRQWYAWVPGGSWFFDDGTRSYADATLSDEARWTQWANNQYPVVRDNYGLDCLRYLGAHDGVHRYVGWTQPGEEYVGPIVVRFTFAPATPPVSPWDTYHAQMLWRPNSTVSSGLVSKMFDFRGIRHLGVHL